MISAELTAALQNIITRPVAFIEIELDAGTRYLTTGIAVAALDSHDGNEYVHSAINVGQMTINADGGIAFSFKLPIGDDFIAELYTDGIAGDAITVWVSDERAAVGGYDADDVLIYFAGVLDTAKVMKGEISVNCRTSGQGTVYAPNLLIDENAGFNHITPAGVYFFGTARWEVSDNRNR